MEISSIQLILPGGHCMFMTLRARKIVLVVGGNFERKSWKYNWRTFEKELYSAVHCLCPCVLSHIQPFAIPWTVDCQATVSMGYPRQEYWSGLPFPSPGGSSQPRGGVSCISCMGRQIFYHLSHLGMLPSVISYGSVCQLVHSCCADT